METQTKKYHIWVLGCQMNQADGERLAALLESFGWQRTEREGEADLIAVLACSVRQAGIDRILGKAGRWKKSQRGKASRPAIKILTGCVLPADRPQMEKYFDYIFESRDMEQLAAIIAGRTLGERGDYLRLPALHSSSFSAYVPIGNGCNNFCSYCAVPYTRGRETYRSAGSIIAECRQLIGQGYKEIILLAQNVNSYRDGAIDFPSLLRQVDALAGDYWLRFATSHPKDISAELLSAMAAGRHIAPQLHLAMQSGDDEMLKLMNRHYTAEKFLAILAQAREKIPGISFSTDVIVGFPSETAEQFRRTAELLRAAKFDMAYIAEYSPRAGTAAAAMADDVPREEKQRRNIELNGILQASALANGCALVGRELRVLVDGFKGKQCFGRAANGKIVAFVGEKGWLGSFVMVKITGAEPFVLQGEKL